MTDTLTNDVTIEDAGPAKKRLTITVPAEAISDKIDQSMATLRSETALPGFRKGKAPKSLMERRFGSAVRDETRNQLIADAYSSAIEEHSIRPVGDPEPVTKVEDLVIDGSAPLTFTIEVEVVPEFDIPSFDGIEIKKPTLEITDDHVNTEIERQTVQYGTPEEVKDDFKPDDRFVGPIIATKDGEDEPFFDHNEVAIINPEGDSGQVLGLVIDDLGKKFAKVKIGDTITIKTKGPELHEREDIRGADITIEFTVKRVVRVHPAAIEDICEQYGLPSEEIFREQVKLALTQRRDQEVADAMRTQLFEQIGDKVDFDLPEKLTANQALRAVQQHEMELLYKGVSPDEVETQLAEFRAQSVDMARDRLKLFFLMARLSKEHGVEVSEQEVNGRVAGIAASRGVRPEQLRTELAQAGRLGEIANQIRMHKTADRIIEKAKVTEITADEWQEIVASKRSDAAGKSTTKKKTTKKKTTKKKTS